MTAFFCYAKTRRSFQFQIYKMDDHNHPILPVQATWLPGKRAGQPVLVDPFQHRLHMVKNEGGPKELVLYKCGNAKKSGCPVRVSYSKVFVYLFCLVISSQV